MNTFYQFDIKNFDAYTLKNAPDTRVLRTLLLLQTIYLKPLVINCHLRYGIYLFETSTMTGAPILCTIILEGCIMYMFI